ncbi:MAG: hypothetical protein H0U16_03920 [Actinobacteria bacterium]|nr:hypothetical protein [Actinomycetota bacterium]
MLGASVTHLPSVSVVVYAAKVCLFNGNANGGFQLLGALSRVRHNLGWVTENRGVASVANGDTITHALSATPTRASLTPSVSGDRTRSQR